MSAPVISVENLSKSYLLGHLGRTVDERNANFRDIFGRELRNAARKGADLLRGRQVIQGDVIEEFWALKDVNFEVREGEVLGIIGRNGAGKSTLLKILSRITEPTKGRVTLHGRVASLLEVGTGFHPELTGRENIFLNGAILGMSRNDIRKRFDEIVAFSEVERFLDTPVKRYSSGMYVRLAFAVAAHMEPEILIVDEVLAVGDAAFQKKCMGKMSTVASENRTVLFVSHNMAAIKTLTTNSVLLDQGRVAATGKSEDVVTTFLARMLDTKAEALKAKDLTQFRRWKKDDVPARIREIRIAGSSEASEVLPEIELGTGFTIEICLSVYRTMEAADLMVVLKTSQGEPVASLVASDSAMGLSLQPGERVVQISVDDMLLAPGRYYAEVWMEPIIDGDTCDAIFDYPLLSVVNKGLVTHRLNRQWGSVYSKTAGWNVGP
jgi:lipopolysaccharide transport system ATP-binding protein